MTTCTWSRDETPTHHLPIHLGIYPAEVRRLGVTLSLAYCKSLDPDHTLYDLLNVSSDARPERLKSRRPFVRDARNLFKQPYRTWHLCLSVDELVYGRKYCENKFRISIFVPGPVPGLLE